MAVATAHGRYHHDHASKLDRGTVIAGGCRDKSEDSDRAGQGRLIIEWTTGPALPRTAGPARIAGHLYLRAGLWI